MIPKTIHYCWFSGEKKPRKIRHCLRSWKRPLVGYTIKCWTAKDIPSEVMSIPFVKEAFELKRWASVSDYMRFYILFHEGGIYLDSDVEVFQNFDAFLQYDFFAGTDKRSDKDVFGVEGAVMGSVKGLPIMRDLMRYYEEKDCFLLPDNTMNCSIIPDMMIPFFTPMGYQPINKTQTLEGNMIILSLEHFRNSMSPIVIDHKFPIAYHHNTATWVPYFHNRSRLYNFLRRNDLLFLYIPLEWLTKRLRSVRK